MADDGTDLRLVDSNNNQQHCLHGLDLLFVTWSDGTPTTEKS